MPYVLAVAPTHLVRLGEKAGYASIRVDEWLARKRHLRWSRRSAGWGSKGPRWFDWTWWKMDAQVPEGWQAWIVVRRSISDPTDLLVHLVCAPKQPTLPQIVQVAGHRWKVEEAIERAKGDGGLDQYEVRSWTGWYRQVTLWLLAQCCATVMAQQANAEQEKKPGSRTAVQAVCSSSHAGEDWSPVDPLHPPRGAALDLVPGLRYTNSASGENCRCNNCTMHSAGNPDLATRYEKWAKDRRSCNRQKPNRISSPAWVSTVSRAPRQPAAAGMETR